MSPSDSAPAGNVDSIAWNDWVSATATRSYCKDDPLLDWLRLYGEAHGFLSDEQAEGFDSRTYFLAFILKQGQLFEQAVLRHLNEKVAPVTEICTEREHVQSEAKRDETLSAMRAGRPLIGQAVLWNPARRTYGAGDLLVRSDLFRALWPDLISEEESRIAAFELGQPYHYRVLDIKFCTVKLLKDGHLSGALSHYMAQVWIYNEALGNMQGFEPPAGYILGRGWADNTEERGRDCMERLGRVDRDYVFRKGLSLEDLVAEAVAWVRRVRSEGAGWQVLPEPTVPQLYPNMNHTADEPWHSAKKHIADALDELTLLWNVRVTGREEAHRTGIRRWTDPDLTTSHVGVNGIKVAPTLQAILEINRSQDGPVILPERVHAAEEEWRDPDPVEFYVDFEFVNNLADDFTKVPEEGGQPLIFMIGCGHTEDGQWRFFQWTCDHLSEACEEQIIDDWLAHMAAVSGSAALPSLAIHWAPAEPINYQVEYDSAKKRHPDKNWPELRWFDFLNKVIKAEPVVVRGAMGFGLKTVARAMRQHGCIETEWTDGPADGLGAMVGAWSCEAEAAATSAALPDLPLMQSIAHYNQVDCKVMQEIVAYLRRKH